MKIYKLQIIFFYVFHFTCNIYNNLINYYNIFYIKCLEILLLYKATIYKGIL